MIAELDLEENLIAELSDLLDATNIPIKTITPSQWYEDNMYMPQGSAIPGFFSYEPTPYWREVVDNFDRYSPTRTITVMKGAQIGCSAAVITPIIGYTIAINPCKIIFLTGHSDLTTEAVVNVDFMIDNTGLRPRIQSQVQRARKQKTGDTNDTKEFPGGDLKTGAVGNHNMHRQRDARIILADDVSAAPMFMKKTGDTRTVIEQRVAASATKSKVGFFSSPQIMGECNIYAAFITGDQRYWHVPCPCCGEMIVLIWSKKLSPFPEHRKQAEDTTAPVLGGITWQIDKNNMLIPETVGYTCQECGGFFTEKEKHKIITLGRWIPTNPHGEPNHRSYQVSALYGAPEMYNWNHYINKYLAANPPGQEPRPTILQSFVNVCLGIPYQPATNTLPKNVLQKNIRQYQPGIIPETMSMADGNGKLVLLTCAIDLNGTEHDARLDYEILAHSETGSTYSITHGSIGTFIPRESQMANPPDRPHYTYLHHQPNSVWTELQTILSATYTTDTNRRMRIAITGMDIAYQNNHAYTYIDNANLPIVGLRGKDDAKFTRETADLPTFTVGKERANLYLIQSNTVKDHLAELINLKHIPHNNNAQPPGFMNFPTPANGLYLHQNYFSHFEAEERVPVTTADGTLAIRWQKTDTNAQNHMFDCRCYNLALRHIFLHLLAIELKQKQITWPQFIQMINNPQPT